MTLRETLLTAQEADALRERISSPADTQEAAASIQETRMSQSNGTHTQPTTAEETKISEIEPAPRSDDEIRAGRLRRQQMLQRQTISKDETELYQGLVEDRDTLEGHIATLQSGLGKGIVADEVIESAITDAQTELGQIRVDIESRKQLSPVAVAEKILHGLRAERLSGLTEQVRDIQPHAPDFQHRIRHVLHQCALQEVFRVSTASATEISEPDIIWEEKRYYACTDTDAQLIALVARAIQAFQTAEEAKAKQYHNEVVRYLLPNTPDADEHGGPTVRLWRESEQTVRQLTRFLNGEGQRCFVPIFNLRDTGRRGKFGEAILERDGDLIICRYVTGWERADELAHKLFFRFDHQADRYHPPIDRLVIRTTGRNLDSVHPMLLRENMRKQLERDHIRAERKTAAQRLKDVSAITQPILTYADVLAGGKEGIWPVCVPQTQRRELTFHVNADGRRNFRISETVDNSRSYHDIWMNQYHEWQPVTELTRDDQWKEIARQNQRFERDWQLERQTREQNAYLTSRDNYLGVIAREGVDGVYAIKGSRHSGRNRTWLGCILERTENLFTVVWAVPGPSERFFVKHMNKGFTIDALPEPIRHVLRGTFMFFNKEDEMPPHIANVETVHQESPPTQEGVPSA